jgi:spore germination protein GerM
LPREIRQNCQQIVPVNGVSAVLYYFANNSTQRAARIQEYRRPNPYTIMRFEDALFHILNVPYLKSLKRGNKIKQVL